RWLFAFFFFSSRRRHTRFSRDWSSDVCSSDLTRGAAQALWQRFPKFVLGFIAASAIASWYLAAGGASQGITAVNTFRAYFLILAFVSIGLEFRLTRLLAEGWRPVVVFGSATVFNLAVALLIASLVFAGFEG